MNSTKNLMLDDKNKRNCGIIDLIVETNMVGNVIAAVTSQQTSYEPLPIINYSLFDENYCYSFNKF